MPRFFLPAAQISQSRAFITGPEFHHLRHVLRLTTGDSVTLCDDNGGEYQGHITHCSTTGAEIVLTALPVSVPAFSLTVAQGILKGPRMDLVIEKVTELGARRIVPFFSTFTVVHAPQDQWAERLARWHRLAQSATKQSGNPVPVISSPQSFRDLLTTPGDGVDKVLLYEKERTLTLKTFARGLPACSSLWAVIGPEGGFAPEEVDQARAAGFRVVGLGTQILRAETASIATVALCQFLWGDGGAKNSSL